MTRKLKLAPSKAKEPSGPYAGFATINGTHPLKSIIPAIYVPYQVRVLPDCEVVYFNFGLAKEMGLINKNHDEVLNKDLKKSIVEAFGIRIINEFDILNDVKFDPKSIKHHTYMATRYLQLQHKNKQGKTSGDGRSIWNGCFESPDSTLWDISSRGTGATILSPAFADTQTPIQTGDPEVSYGCGLAELDEMYGSLILSEIFHKKGIPTERMLAIIDTGNGYCVGIRASMNLLRPAHFFRFLKQADYKNLKNLVDYHISRQIQNREWKKPKQGDNLYDFFLEEIAFSFGSMAAILEEEYIFTWLDWDGDNVLTDGSILDYGSIRQFGIYHDAYRYDDVDRFSTNLNEQKYKARFIIQVFAQVVDFVKTGNKKNLQDFQNHKILKKFDRTYKEMKENHLLHKAGFDDAHIQHLLLTAPKKVHEFSRLIRYFETKKINAKIQKVQDGVNIPPLFNMRNFLFEFPTNLRDRKGHFTPQQFVKKFASSFARKKDKKVNTVLHKRIQLVQDAYKELLNFVPNEMAALQLIYERSQVINRPDRITGDAAIMIVDKIITKVKRSHLNFQEAQEIIEIFIKDQLLIPEFYQDPALKSLRSSKKKALILHLKKIVNDYREGI